MSETDPIKTERLIIAEVIVITKWFFGFHRKLVMKTNADVIVNNHYIAVANIKKSTMEYFPYANLISWSTKEIKILVINSDTRETISETYV